MKKCVGLLLFFAVLMAQAQSEPGGMALKNLSKILGLPSEFSAQIEVVTGLGGEGAMVMNSRMYVGKDAMRYEMDMPGGFGTMTTLALLEGELTKLYMLSPKQKFIPNFRIPPARNTKKNNSKLRIWGQKMSMARPA